MDSWKCAHTTNCTPVSFGNSCVRTVVSPATFDSIVFYFIVCCCDRYDNQTTKTMHVRMFDIDSLFKFGPYILHSKLMQG